MSALAKAGAGLCCAAILAFGATTMQTGKAGLKSAGALAIGPDGILFVGDTAGAAIYALDVNDKTPAKGSANVEVKGINEKIAAMLGTAADQILIQDVVVNSVSKNVYIAVSPRQGRRCRPRHPPRRPGRQNHRSLARQHQALVRQPAGQPHPGPPAPGDHHPVEVRRRQGARRRPLQRRVLLQPARDPVSRSRRPTRAPASRSGTARTAASKPTPRSGPSSRTRSTARPRSSPPTPAPRWCAFRYPS